jgi:uncharacterized sodium:solute symporter family permease YidK
MAIVFAVCLGAMALATLLAPLREPVVLESKTSLDLSESKGARTAGIVCIILTVLLYIIFSPWVLAK